MAEEKPRHVVPGEYMYEGLVYLGAVQVETLERIKYQFELRDDDVIIVTYPRSGTSWYCEIAWLLMNDGDVDRARHIDQEKRTPILEVSIPNVESVLDMLEKAESPRMMKTHLKFDYYLRELKLNKRKTKVILGARNVKDNLVSFYHFYRMNSLLGNMTGTFSEFFEMFQDKRLAGGDWFDHVLSFWSNSHHFDYFWLKYEDLHKDLLGTIKKLAAFLGKGLSEEKLKAIADHVSFDQLKSNKMVNKEDYPFIKTEISPYMRKGEVGDWKNYFTEEQNEYVDKLYREKIEGTGLEFDFELENTKSIDAEDIKSGEHEESKLQETKGYVSPDTIDTRF